MITGLCSNGMRLNPVSVLMTQGLACHVTGSGSDKHAKPADICKMQAGAQTMLQDLAN